MSIVFFLKQELWGRQLTDSPTKRSSTFRRKFRQPSKSSKMAEFSSRTNSYVSESPRTVPFRAYSINVPIVRPSRRASLLTSTFFFFLLLFFSSFFISHSSFFSSFVCCLVSFWIYLCCLCRFVLYDDIPLFWDAWDVEIYSLEKVSY